MLPARLASDGHQGAWKVFSRLNDAVAPDPVTRTPVVRAAFAPLEQKIEQERAEAEREAGSAAASGDPDGACERVTEFMRRATDAALARAGEIAAGL